MKISAYVKWALKAGHTFGLEWIFTEWTVLFTAFGKEKRLVYGFISNRLAAMGLVLLKAVSADIETVKKSSHQSDLQKPFLLKLWNASTWSNFWKCCLITRIRFPTTDVQQWLKTSYNWNPSYFPSWGLWFLFLFRHYALGDIFCPCLMNCIKRSSGGIERSWCRQFWKLIFWYKQRNGESLAGSPLVAGGVTKRLDLAINDKDRDFKYPCTHWKVPTGRMHSVFRSF